MNLHRHLLIASIVLGGSVGMGCAHQAQLVPVKEAKTVTPYAPNTKVAMTVEETPWTNSLRSVWNHVTPVAVTIKNNSSVPVIIRYSDLSIFDDRGMKHEVLPPALTEGNRVRNMQIRTPKFTSRDFYVAPHLLQAYPSLIAWNGDFDMDIEHLQTYSAKWPAQSLTNDMIERAIPEGVIGPGGEISGVLYFERIDPKATKRIDFSFAVQDADTDQAIGTLAIPFAVETAA